MSGMVVRNVGQLRIKNDNSRQLCGPYILQSRACKDTMAFHLPNSTIEEQRDIIIFLAASQSQNFATDKDKISSYALPLQLDGMHKCLLLCFFMHCPPTHEHNHAGHSNYVPRCLKYVILKHHIHISIGLVQRSYLFI